MRVPVGSGDLDAVAKAAALLAQSRVDLRRPGAALGDHPGPRIGALLPPGAILVLRPWPLAHACSSSPRPAPHLWDLLASPKPSSRPAAPRCEPGALPTGPKCPRHALPEKERASSQLPSRPSPLCPLGQPPLSPTTGLCQRLRFHA